MAGSLNRYSSQQYAGSYTRCVLKKMVTECSESVYDIFVEIVFKFFVTNSLYAINDCTSGSRCLTTTYLLGCGV